ncbi:FAD-dependent oxidoreductase [Vallicoccus soli]|uniref:FAD-dependent oxidoreductase n=1 Tax=Vallicoccus soli TaxID=2339232 RepID=A0A3A3Z8R0_9ACTN|nr:FAD-dependent oxidoreductase [Vallicoccus soli]
MSSVTVVGSSLAGLSTARALRAGGYDGRLLLVGEEDHAPYDRPPLSKALLAGEAQEDDLALLEDGEDLALDVRRGVRAVRLDPADRAVVLGTGERVVSDAVVVATGAHARRLAAGEGLAGVHLLRTLDDARALRADLVAGSPRVVVVGAGFIGSEVASTARGLGLDVTVVEALAVPLAGSLGPQVGAAVARLHEDHGTRLLTGDGVAGLRADGGRVCAVVLADGRELPADVVVVGVGVVPATDWLHGSGVELRDGVVCDARCRTAVPGVLAVGDVARAVHGWTGTHLRLEHWTSAVEQAQVAAATLLGRDAPAAVTAPPYVWSDQYGTRLQLAGRVPPGAAPEVVEGSLAERPFAAVWRADGAPVAALAVGLPRTFGRLRRTLRPPVLAG